MDSIERRAHARVEIPLIVELQHLTIGTQTAQVKNISEGGLFVATGKTNLPTDARVKIRPVNSNEVENLPSPTIDAVVRRVTEEGVGLEFQNRTGEHLWQSVQRERTQLEVGRDYFQVFQSIALQNPSQRILLLQQNGRWRLPGCYLAVGDDHRNSLETYIRDLLDVRFTWGATLNQASQVHEDVPEAAIFRITYHGTVDIHTLTVENTSEFTNHRWIGNPRTVRELTMVSEFDREIVLSLLDG